MSDDNDNVIHAFEVETEDEHWDPEAVVEFTAKMRDLGVSKFEAAGMRVEFRVDAWAPAEPEAPTEAGEVEKQRKKEEQAREDAAMELELMSAWVE